MMKDLFRREAFLLVLSVALAAAPAYAAQIEDFFRKGQRAYDQGHHAEAITFFEQAVELDENFAPAYNALGLAHHAAGSPLSDVVWFFRVAADLDKGNAEIYGNLCRVYSQAREFDEAEKACRQALTLQPGMGNVQLMLAWIYLSGKEQPQDAIYYFQQVLERVQDPSIYFGLGMAYSLAGDNARALETITTLRGAGANDLANRLEDAIRGSAGPVGQPGTPPDAAVSVPQRTKGTLIQAQPTPGPLPEERSRSPFSGQMQIRLKGKLSDPDPK